MSREVGKRHLWIVAGVIYSDRSPTLDARLLGRAAGIGFTQKLKRKANEDEIPRRKKQLRSCFAVLEGADRGWEVSQSRALVGFIFIRRLGYKL